MAAPTYSQQFSIGLLGTVSNVLAQPMAFYRCTVCGSVVAEGQTGTVGRDLHTKWHADLDATAAAASKASSDAAAAKTAATTAADAATKAATSAQTAASDATAAKSASSSAASAAASASQAASTSSTAATAAATAADRASTAAQTSSGDAKLAEDSASVSSAALRAVTESSGMCPLCRAAVPADKITIHLTYHYRRAHGDPVEFPADFDPTTGDMRALAPPMRTNMAEPCESV